MTKRIITPIIGLLLLLATATGTTGVGTLATGKPPSLKEQIRADMERAIEDMLKNAIYDAAGRMSKVTIVLPHLGAFNFECKYDQENRLQYILDEKGGRTQYEYNKSGELQSITLPNSIGTFRLDKGGKGGFFKQVMSPGRYNIPKRQLVGTNGLRLRRVAMMDDLGSDECKAAVLVAAAAWIAAGAACASGDVLNCARLTTAAAAASYAAYVACSGDNGGPPPPKREILVNNKSSDRNRLDYALLWSKSKLSK